jgi:hypothetical protein
MSHQLVPPIAKIAEILGGEVKGLDVLAPGPGHSDADRSLSVRPDNDASDGFICHSFAGDDPIACRDYVREKLGLPKREPKEKKKDGKGNGITKPYSPTIANYIYRLKDGAPYLCVHRLADKSGFPQYHWDGEKWISGKPKGPKIPYRLPELMKAAPGTRIWICEGEKDADNLANLGFVATCNSEGAEEGTGKKFTSDLAPYFKDHHCFVLEDNDAKGRKHAAYVARVLDPVAASVRVVRLPGLPEKGDVSDWLKHDTAGTRLVKEADSTPPWEPTADDHGGDHGRDRDGDDDELVAELAGLSALAYAKRRKDAAEKIGIGVGELDKIVKEARGESADKSTLARWEIEPWDEPVATAELLEALRGIYAAHVILPDEHGAATMALWTLHAWTIEASYVSPFLMFTSPEMRCGKSKALALLFRTGPRTAFASNISPAAIFRYVEGHQPALIIDEADTFARDNEELRGILNSGHTRDTAHVIRCEGDANEPKEFSTWAPKAIAGIGKLAATLMDRSIILSMKRKLPGEPVAKLRAQDTEEFMNLRRKAARWTNDNLDQLKDARPEIPGALNDRAQDNWESILAIADLAAGEWPKIARAAALALSAAAEANGDTLKAQLLADIKAVFATQNADRVTTKFLIDQLVEDDAKPWGSYGKDGKPITGAGVARLLKDFGIRPTTLKEGKVMAKGYFRTSFREAWERYVPASFSSDSVAEGVSSRNPVTSATTATTYTQNQSVTSGLWLRIENEANPLKDKDRLRGYDSIPPAPEDKGVEAAEEGQEDRACVQCHGSVDGKERHVALGGHAAVWLHPECERFYLKERRR